LKSLAGKGSCTASSSRQKSSNTDEFSLYDVGFSVTVAYAKIR
jgi:hypothetical protein